MTATTNLYKSDNGAHAVEAEYRRLLASWPVEARRFHIPTSLGDTFVITCGSEAAAPLVLLHGGGVNSSMWLADVGSFAPHFRVYAIDLPGEPGFSSSERPPLTDGSYSTWLDEVLKALSVARPSVIGASLGGWLALDYASRHPDRIDRLVLLGPMGVGRVRPSFLLMMMALLPFGGWGRQRLLRSILGPIPGPSSFPDLRLLSLIQKHFRSRMTPIPILTDSALNALTMPVHAIVGDKDVILNSQETKQRLELKVADSRVVTVHGAGHRLFGTAGAVLEFLKPSHPRFH